MQSFREAFLNKDPAEKMFAYFAVLVRVANRPTEEKSIGGCFDGVFGNESPDVFFQFCPLTIPHEAVSLLNFVDKFEAFFQYFGQMVTVVVVHNSLLSLFRDLGKGYAKKFARHSYLWPWIDFF